MKDENQFGVVDIIASFYLKDYIVTGFPKNDLKSQVTLAYNIAETILEYKERKKLEEADKQIDQQFANKINSLTQEEIEYAKSLLQEKCPKCKSINIQKIVLTTLSPEPRYIFTCADCHFQEERRGTI
jgi:phage FluMu protein Com